MFDFQGNLKPIFILKLHYLQNPWLSETKQWIKQRCIFTHKNCHFQFNPKVTLRAVRVLCWLLSKSERQRRIPGQANITERLLSPLKETNSRALSNIYINFTGNYKMNMIFDIHYCKQMLLLIVNKTKY